MTSPASISHADVKLFQQRHRGSASTILSNQTVIIVWMLSMLFHLLGLCLMFLFVFPSRGNESLLEPPTTQVMLVGPIDGARFDSSSIPDQNTQVMPSEIPLIRFRPKTQEPLLEAPSFKNLDLSIIGIGAGGGDFSELGFTIHDQAGPEFFGLGSNARGVRTVVYVVDRSASMIDTSIYVREELKRSISALRRSQKFHVIFFNSGEPLEFSPMKPVNAIDARKDQVYKFIDQVDFIGATKPESAMRRAFAVEPDLIYFLSDGVLTHSRVTNPRLMQLLNEWNEDRKVRIFTIAYLDQSGGDLLKLIAREHGGEFKFVSENDLP